MLEPELSDSTTLLAASAGILKTAPSLQKAPLVKTIRFRTNEGSGLVDLGRLRIEPEQPGNACLVHKDEDFFRRIVIDVVEQQVVGD